MCLINEKKSDVKEVIGYAVVEKDGTEYHSYFQDDWYLEEPVYAINTRYKAKKESEMFRIRYSNNNTIPGFHGFYTIKDANEYLIAGKLVRRVIVMCKFEDVIAIGNCIRCNGGKLKNSLPSFRAMYRTIIEEVYVWNF